MTILLLSVIALTFAISHVLFHHRVPAEYTRKLIHCISAIVIAIFPLIMPLLSALVLAGLFLVLIFFLENTRIFPALTAVPRKTWGASMFIVGITLTALFTWQENPLAFQFGVLVLGFADAGASLAGIVNGQKKKSVKGSGAFLVIVLVLLLMLRTTLSLPVTPVWILEAITLSLVLSVIEHLSLYGTDNAILPVLAGVAGMVML